MKRAPHGTMPGKPRNRWTVLGVVLSAALWITALAAPRVTAAAAGELPPDFQVIVHPSNTLSTASRDFLQQAFFKRTTRWDDGAAIHPVDLPPNSKVRGAFSGRVLNRSVAAVRSYWQQRIFSGRELPPPELESDEAVIRYVASSPGAVGYISPHAKPTTQAKLLVVH